MRQGPWVVQRAVGTKPLIVGRALKVLSFQVSTHQEKFWQIRFFFLQVTYHSSQHHMEVDIDIGSSTVANNIVRFVLGYACSPRVWQDISHRG